MGVIICDIPTPQNHFYDRNVTTAKRREGGTGGYRQIDFLKLLDTVGLVMRSVVGEK
jgi:hypothetical protein